MKIRSAAAQIKAKPIKAKKPFSTQYKLNPYKVGRGRGIK